MMDCRLPAAAGELHADCRIVSRDAQRSASSRSRSALCSPRSALRPLPFARRGVTLVELLITITIIAILGSAILGVASVAMNTAREARTRNLVARLHSLLAEHYDTYKVRRVKLRPLLKQDIENRFVNNSRVRGEALAQARLYAMRELMLMEVPDRWSDVAFDQVGNPARLMPLYYAERTGLSTLYARQYERLRNTTNTISGQTNTPAEIAANQGAECLYLVIMNACGDGEARGQFGESDIGDTDGDGAPEFLDSWGRPIDFLRWAPGFVSDAQLNVYNWGADGSQLQSVANQNPSPWSSAADLDHDPFDIFRRDRLAFRLQPLIYSAGNDGRYGIERNDATQVWYTSALGPAPPPLYFQPRLTPYEQFNLDRYTGAPIDRSGAIDLRGPDSTDNIHSHLIGTRAE